MAKRGSGVDKMLCQIYNSRGGRAFDEDEWDEFCEENDLTDEFAGGNQKRQPAKRDAYIDDEE